MITKPPAISESPALLGGITHQCLQKCGISTVLDSKAKPTMNISKLPIPKDRSLKSAGQ